MHDPPSRTSPPSSLLFTSLKRPPALFKTNRSILPSPNGNWKATQNLPFSTFPRTTFDVSKASTVNVKLLRKAEICVGLLFLVFFAYVFFSWGDLVKMRDCYSWDEIHDETWIDYIQLLPVSEHYAMELVSKACNISMMSPCAFSISFNLLASFASVDTRDSFLHARSASFKSQKIV